MSVSSKASTIFTQAITEHLKVIQALQSQQPVLEEIAAQMTRAILAGMDVSAAGAMGVCEQQMAEGKISSR
jgi:hypothetical protein